MNVGEYIHEMALRARAAAAGLRKLSTAEKNALLLGIAAALETHRDEIFAANAEDVAAAKARGISAALVDRLTLNDARFRSMVDGVRHVATLPDPVGEVLWTRERPSGITIRKIREPFGVVAVVFESRPNVFVDTAALCLKTGNAIILRGGKEAIGSNAALAKVVAEALDRTAAGPAAATRESRAVRDAVQFVEIPEHEAVTEMVRAVGLIDVAIPRGGERLIRAMCEAALIPVLKHYKGVCHVYVDDEADMSMALSILDNAKRQRPSACNAAECLLVHEKLAPMFLPMVEAWADGEGVTLHRPADSRPREDARLTMGGGPAAPEHGEDEGTEPRREVEWEREFLGLEMNVGVVKDCRAAIDHINRHGSHHSDCIVTNNAERAKEFLRDVDSACVYHNVSTRFTDGAEFGMGAEIGISTDKLHARGPMGLEELTTYKYTVTGDGVIRG